MEPLYKDEAQSGVQSKMIIAALAYKSLSMNELVVELGLKSKTGSLKRSMNTLLEEEFVEYTIPDKPGSRLQQYCLTKKGQQ